MTPSVLMDVRGGSWAFHRCQIRAADGGVALGLYGWAKVFSQVYTATRASELSALCWFSYDICGWGAAAISVLYDSLDGGCGRCLLSTRALVALPFGGTRPWLVPSCMTLQVVYESCLIASVQNDFLTRRFGKAL